MWQRARLLRNDPPDQQEELLGLVGEPPVGFTFWVRCLPPNVIIDGEHFLARYAAHGDGNGYATNIYHPNGKQRLSVAASSVELLAEFCDQPPRIPWGSWNHGTPPER